MHYQRYRMRIAGYTLAAGIMICAPVVSEAEITAGVKIGPSITGYWGDDADEHEDLNMSIGGLGTIDADVSPRFGLAVAGFFGVVFRDIFVIQPEFMFAMKGRTYEFSTNILGSSSTTTVKMKLSCLELPLLFEARIPLDGWMPYAYAGPSLGVLAAAEAESETENSSGTNENEEDIEDDLKTFDFLLHLGAGVAFDAGPGRLFVELRYAPGFVDIYEDDDDPQTEEPKLRNHGFCILAGYGL